MMEELESSSFVHLQRGFQELQQIQQDDGVAVVVSSSDVERRTQRRVLVNVLDPAAVTSFSAAASSPTNASSSFTSSSVGGANNNNNNTPQQPQALHQRFSALFRSSYGSRISNVQYKDARLGSKAEATTIPHIDVQCRCLESQVDLLQNPLEQLHEQMEETADNSTHLMTNLETAWHRMPMCFVYFVTCQSTEDYRTKVKPGIQVFLSQLEDLYRHRGGAKREDNGTANETTLANGGDGTVTMAPSYLLVYCPMRSPGSAPVLLNEPTSTTAGSSSQRPALKLANRLRQRMASSSSTNEGQSGTAEGTIQQASDAYSVGNSSSISAAMTPPMSSGAHVSNVDSAGPSSAVSLLSSTSSSAIATNPDAFNANQVLSKTEKEICRRLTADFGTGSTNTSGGTGSGCCGHVITMTILGNDHYKTNFSNSSMKSDLEELERLEWGALLKELSKAILHGFETTTRYLEEVLKDIQYRAAATTGTSDNIYKELFLIKESIALTYEQMNLPNQALLQYNELRAMLPDLSAALTDYLASQTNSNAITDRLDGNRVLEEGEKNESFERKTVQEWLADMQSTNTYVRNPIVYRKRLKRGFQKQSGTIHDHKYYSLAPFIETYLWERETDLLFQMGDVVEVVRRSLAFCDALFEYQKQFLRAQNPKQINEEDETGITETLMQLDEWAFCFCWDLKRASQAYLQSLASKTALATSNQNNAAVHRTPPDLFGKHLCDVLSYARLRLLGLANCKLSSVISSDPRSPPVIAIMGKKARRRVPTDVTTGWSEWSPELRVEAPPSKLVAPGTDLNSASFIKSSFESSSRDDFLTHYIHFMRVLISLSAFAGRHRSAARLSMELVGLHLERGEIEQAAEPLKSVTKLYGREGWKSCNFLVHFRLAGFRRQFTLPKEYLATIVQCFGRRNNARNFIPTKALEVLCDDFEAVMTVLLEESSSANEARPVVSFTNSPIFETILKHSSEGNVRILPHRRLARKVYLVGDKSRVMLTLTSHLAKAIDGVTISAVLVPYKSYVTAVEDGKPVAETNTSRIIISLPNKVCLQCGENEFEIAWTAAVSGQFVLTQVSVAYKAATFLYTYERMKEPFRIDVLPGQPTQKMDVKPHFLLPGHEQQLSIHFNSGDDKIVQGELNLVCSPGLVLRPSANGDDGGNGWSSACKFILESCPPNTTQVLVASVRSANDDQCDTGIPPSVHAKITTLYALAAKADEHVKHSVVEDDDMFEAQYHHDMEFVVPTLGEPALSIENVSLNTYAVGRSLLSISTKCHVPSPFRLVSWRVELPPNLEVIENNHDMNQGLQGLFLEKGETVSFAFDCSHQKEEEEEALGSKSSSPSGGGFFIAELEDEYKTRYEERKMLRFKQQPSSLEAKLIDQMQLLELTAELISLSSSEEKTNGVVGVPMRIKYEMDATAILSWLDDGGESSSSSSSSSRNCCCYYALDSKCNGWLICGQTRGRVELDNEEGSNNNHKWTMERMVIPTNPGAGKEVPSVILTFITGHHRDGILNNQKRSIQITIPTKLLSTTTITTKIISSSSPIQQQQLHNDDEFKPTAAASTVAFLTKSVSSLS